MTPARPAIRRFEHISGAPPDVDRILVIRLGALGDVVRTFPAVEAIREHYPRCTMTWLVEAGAASVLEGQEMIDKVLVFPREELSALLARGSWFRAATRTRSFLRELRAARSQLVFDFHSILKSGILARLSGAPRRVGLQGPEGREFSWLFSNWRVPSPPQKRSRFDRNSALIRFVGIEGDSMRHYRYVTRPDDVARMTGGGERPERVVAIHPGTSPGKSYKRYAPRRYGQVAQMLWERHGIRSVVIQGTEDAERSLAQTVVETSKGAAELAPRVTEASDLAALLKTSRIFIGSDTGPLHLASLVGTPVVQILGPTDPVQNAPFEGTPSRQLRVPIGCSPCRRGCEPAPCMGLVPPARVFRAAEELLFETSRPGEFPGRGLAQADVHRTSSKQERSS